MNKKWIYLLVVIILALGGTVTYLLIDRNKTNNNNNNKQQIEKKEEEKDNTKTPNIEVSKDELDYMYKLVNLYLSNEDANDILKQLYSNNLKMSDLNIEIKLAYAKLLYSLKYCSDYNMTLEEMKNQFGNDVMECYSTSEIIKNYEKIFGVILPSTQLPSTVYSFVGPVLHLSKNKELYARDGWGGGDSIPPLITRLEDYKITGNEVTLLVRTGFNTRTDNDGVSDMTIYSDANLRNKVTTIPAFINYNNGAKKFDQIDDIIKNNKDNLNLYAHKFIKNEKGNFVYNSIELIK